MLTKMIPTWSTKYALSQKNIQEIQIQWNQLPRLMWTLQCDVELKWMNVCVANGWKILNWNSQNVENWQINTQNSHIRIWRNDWTLSWMRERTCRRKTPCRQFALIHSKVFIKTSWRLAVRESGNFRSSWNKKTEQVASEKTFVRKSGVNVFVVRVHAAIYILKNKLMSSIKKFWNLYQTVWWWEWQKCLYPTRLDTYWQWCSHNCSYCYARALLDFRWLRHPENPKFIDLKEAYRIIAREIPKDQITRLWWMNDWLFSTRWENSQNHIQRSESIQQMQKTIFDYHKIRFDCNWRISWSIRQRPCTYSNHNHFNEWWTCGEIRTRNKTVRQNQSNWEIAKVVIRCSNQIVAIYSTIHWNWQNQCNWMRQDHCWILACESLDQETIQSWLFRIYIVRMMILAPATW